MYINMYKYKYSMSKIQILREFFKMSANGIGLGVRVTTANSRVNAYTLEHDAKPLLATVC
jgi:hypothetical protein